MQKKGSITVFYSLILTLMLSLISSFLLSAKVSAGRALIAMAMDQSMYSAMAKYDAKLFDAYNLFFIDGGVGQSTLQLGNLMDELQEDMLYGLSPSKDKRSYDAVDFIKLQLEDYAVLGYALATDQKGSVFREQVLRYMKDTMVLQGISSLTEINQNSGDSFLMNVLGHIAAVDGFDGKDIFIDEAAGASYEQLEQLAEQLPIEQLETEAVETELLDAQSIGTRVQEVSVGETVMALDMKEVITEVHKTKNHPVLNKLIQAPQMLSDWCVSKEERLSNRELQQGMGVISLQETSSMSDRILFQTYLFDHLNYYGHSVQSTGPAYGIEYLIGGKSSDVENLEAIAKKLLLVREAANVAYLITNPQKRASAEAVSSVLAAILVIPEIQPAIEAAILFAWAYVESLVDVRGLFSGNAVPLWKSDAAWQVDLGELLVAYSDLDRYAVSYGTASYKEYLSCLLWLESEETKTMRCLDVIEQSMRGIKGKENFSMDCAIDLLEVQMTVRVEDRKVFEITEKRSYRTM